MYNLRVVSTGKYDDRGYSNEESIAYLQLQKPVAINQFLTYNYGKDENQFPLLFMTEGQGTAGTVEIDTVEWTWDVMGKQEWTDYVTFAPQTAKPGVGGTDIEVHFATHRFIEQHGLIAPDGKTQVRIQKDLGESAYGYAYILRLITNDPNAFVDFAENLTKGKYWSMTGTTVSESYSVGNRSNTMGPGKMKSQLGFYRYSKEIAGNLGNVVTKYEFTDGKGAKNRLWINEEMRQFNVHMRKMNEEKLWNSTYNRNERGEITLKDYDNGKPIPQTAGMLEICSNSNYDTYGEILTVSKIKRIIGDLLDNDSDDGTMQVVLMAGKGFMEDFDMAMRLDSKDNGFLTPLGDKMISGEGGNLTYGAYFRAYKTIEGHTITVKHCSYFDKGSVAEAARKNGRVHPRTGLPITSHQAAFIDFSRYDGVSNVRIVHQKNQVYKARVVQGMTDIPASWGIPTSSNIATPVDASRYEVKGSLGLQVNNSKKMCLIECVL